MPKSFQNPANDDNDAFYSNNFYLLFKEHNLTHIIKFTVNKRFGNI
ncbi:MAG TPA: hypothetical protein VEW92_00235 [Nitrososphaeraceae archaeon]|jgi:hypothetical protein|nr:hypothetical protein [Nitrososphaeraceae archaeon]